MVRHLKLCCGTGGRRYRISSIPVGSKRRNTQPVVPLLRGPGGRSLTTPQAGASGTEAKGSGRVTCDPTRILSTVGSWRRCAACTTSARCPNQSWRIQARRYYCPICAGRAPNRVCAEARAGGAVPVESLVLTTSRGDGRVRVRGVKLIIVLCELKANGDVGSTPDVSRRSALPYSARPCLR